MQSDRDIRAPQLLDRIASSPELMREFQKERLGTEVTELISRMMREKKVTRAELAARLGKSRPFVTKLLRAGSNMTLRTVADVFYALGHSIRVIERPLSVFTPKLAVTEVTSGGISMTFGRPGPISVNAASDVTFTRPPVAPPTITSIPNYVAPQGSLARECHASAAFAPGALGSCTKGV